MFRDFSLAPQVGLEPTTFRLTAERSTDWAIEDYISGSYIFSRDVTVQLSSALKSLTAVFGMGTGVTSSLSPPDSSRLQIFLFICTFKTKQRLLLCFPELPSSSQPLTSLSFLAWSSPRPISISPLNTLLYLHSWPIYHLVFVGSYSCDGISHLEVSFTLRCFQRLSAPDLATQLCFWWNNWCTRGQSIPVLSY